MYILYFIIFIFLKERTEQETEIMSDAGVTGVALLPPPQRSRATTVAGWPCRFQRRTQETPSGAVGRGKTRVHVTIRVVICVCARTLTYMRYALQRFCTL